MVMLTSFSGNFGSPSNSNLNDGYPEPYGHFLKILV